MMAPPIFPVAPKPIELKPIEKTIQGRDYFDSLPDPIVSTILSMVLDAKSLCRCLVVSRRIASLVPEADTVSVVANPTLPKKSPSSLKSLFAKLLRHPAKKKAATNSIGPGELSQWISKSIKNFPEIRHLRVQLPGNGGIVGFPDTNGGLLKWSAEFGKELQRCAVVGATAFERASSACTTIPKTTQTQTQDQDQDQDQNQNQNQDQNQVSDEDLRTRVVWILSSLIAACARHGVVRKTLLDSPNLRSAVVVDALKQGRLSMGESQIKDLKESTMLEDPIWNRTSVPNVIVKLWYAAELVLPVSGYVMKGATVVAIRPDTGRPEDGGAVGTEYELLRSGFGTDEAEEEVIGEAVREIVKSKCKMMYKLQMKSFQ